MQFLIRWNIKWAALPMAALVSCSKPDTFHAENNNARNKTTISNNVENNGPIPAKGAVLEISPVSAELQVGLTQAFSATLILPDDSKKDVTSAANWGVESKSTKVFSFQSELAGLTKGEAVGQDKIQVTYDGLTATGTITVKAAELVSLEVTPKDAKINVGGSQAFVATAKFSDGSSQNVTRDVQWSILAKDIASIENGAPNGGVATGLTAGNTSVIASLQKLEATASLAVQEISLTSLELTPVNPTISIVGSQKFQLFGVYSDASKKDVTTNATWTSASPAVAAFGASGMDIAQALAKSAGTSQITATLGGKSISTTLTVSPAKLLSITVTPGSSSIDIGQTVGFHATGSYDDGKTSDLTTSVIWASSVPAIAGVSNASGSQGLATGLAAGVVSIRASSGSIVSNDATLTVVKPPEGKFKLTVTKSGTGTGQVTATDLACGAKCEALYTSGVDVTLTAAASTGSEFAGWGGACSGSALTCTVKMSASKSVSAIFNIPVVRLTVTKNGFGKITASGLDCGATCFSDYQIGTNVTLTATPDVGQLFTGWTGACTNATGVCTVAMNAAKSVSANFSSDLAIRATGLQVMSYSLSNGTPGTAKIFMTLSRSNNKTSATNVLPHVLSGDFRITGFSAGTSTLNSSTGKYDQNFEVTFKFRFVPVNKVSYTGQVFRAVVTDSVTAQSTTIDLGITIAICKQDIAQCGSAAANSTVNGAATHPQAIGNL